jgi:epsilon-lactone hydrolase
MKSATTTEIAAIRAMLAANPPTAGSFEDRRQRWEPLYARICPVPAGTKATPLTAPGLKGEWVTAEGVTQHAAPALFYIHGGGFTAGTAVAYRGLTSRLSAASRLPVMAIDYRLAPENPYPAALDDCVAAYRWLVGPGGAAPGRVALGGDSAGGNLVIALMLRLREAGEPMPAACVCLSPVFDLALTGASVTERAARDPMILPESLRRCSAAYLGSADPKTPLASPLYADMRGLPPLLIQMGSEEMLRDDSARLAAKAKAAGVEVALEEWPDMIHVWHLFADRLSDGRRAIDRVGEFLRAHLAG